jgi:hypothetical protein
MNFTNFDVHERQQQQKVLVTRNVEVELFLNKERHRKNIRKSHKE